MHSNLVFLVVPSIEPLVFLHGSLLPYVWLNAKKGNVLKRRPFRDLQISSPIEPRGSEQKCENMGRLYLRA